MRLRSPVPVVVVLLAALGAVSCRAHPGQPGVVPSDPRDLIDCPPPSNPVAESESVGWFGEDIRLPSGNSVDIPFNAVPPFSSRTVEIGDLPGRSLGVDVQVVPDKAFGRRVRLSLDYSRCENAIRAGELTIARILDNGQIVKFPRNEVDQDTAAKTVSVRLAQFSQYAIAAP